MEKNSATREEARWCNVNGMELVSLIIIGSNCRVYCVHFPYCVLCRYRNRMYVGFWWKNCVFGLLIVTLGKTLSIRSFLYKTQNGMKHVMSLWRFVYFFHSFSAGKFVYEKKRIFSRYIFAIFFLLCIRRFSFILSSRDIQQNDQNCLRGLKRDVFSCFMFFFFTCRL